MGRLPISFVAVLLLSITACTSTSSEDPDASPSASPNTTASPATDQSSAPIPAVVEVVLDANADYPILRGSLLPGFIGRESGVGPGTNSLLSDPPNRAVAVYFPEKPIERNGWGDVTVYFIGLDGDWRRLNMGDLGLPDHAYPGGDTYGGGTLSPNGRHWTGSASGGAILVDLATGKSTYAEFPAGGNSSLARWSPASDFVEVLESRRYDWFRFVLTNGVLTESPFPKEKFRGTSVWEVLNPDRWLISGDENNEIQTVNATGTVLSAATVEDEAYIPSILTDDFIVAARPSARRPIRVYDRNDGRLRYSLTQRLQAEKPYPARQLFVLGGSDSVVLQSENRILLWDLEQGSLTQVTSWVPDTKVAYLASDLEIIPLAFSDPRVRS